MAKERRKDAASSSDDDYHKHDIICNDAYDDKNKKSTGIGLLVCITATVPCTRKSLLTLASDCKQNPGRTAKRVVFKLVFYVWCLAVLLSMLSLLGFELNRFPERNGQIASDSVSDQSSWQTMIPEMFQFNTMEEIKPEKETKEEQGDEEIPQQIIPSAPKEGNKLNKKLERQLACEEVNCRNACNKKIKPKCAKSSSCRKQLHDKSRLWIYL